MRGPHPQMRSFESSRPWRASAMRNSMYCSLVRLPMLTDPGSHSVVRISETNASITSSSNTAKCATPAALQPIHGSST